jgi:C4-dicarboxylate transporter DctQ subunit
MRISRFSDILKHFDKIVIRTTEILLFVIGIAFTILIFLEVLSRFIFDFSVFAINAIARFLLLWFFLLGMGLALRKKLHVGFEIFKRRLPIKLARLFECAIHLFVLLFCAEILWSGLLALPPSLGHIVGSLGVSKFWGVLSFPVGIGLMIYHQIAIIFERPPWHSV